MTVYFKALGFFTLAYIKNFFTNKLRSRLRRQPPHWAHKVAHPQWYDNSNSNIADNTNLLTRLITPKDETDGEYLSTDAIIDNVFTLIFAGSDTTASSMTSAIKTLSLNPSLQQDLRNILSTQSEDSNNLDDFITDVLARIPLPHSLCV